MHVSHVLLIVPHTGTDVNQGHESIAFTIDMMFFSDIMFNMFAHRHGGVPGYTGNRQHRV